MCGAIAVAAMQTPQRAGDGEDDIEWIGGIGACGRTPGTEINSRAIGWGWNITPPQSRRCLPDADSLWAALAVGSEGSWPILTRRAVQASLKEPHGVLELRGQHMHDIPPRNTHCRTAELR